MQPLISVHFYSMTKDAYEELVIQLIKSAVVLDHTLDPCKENFIPKNQVIIVYMSAVVFKQYIFLEGSNEKHYSVNLFYNILAAISKFVCCK